MLRANNFLITETERRYDSIKCNYIQHIHNVPDSSNLLPDVKLYYREFSDANKLLDVSLNILAEFIHTLDSSFELSFVCWSAVLNSFVLTDIVLFVSRVPAITFSVKLLITVP